MLKLNIAFGIKELEMKDCVTCVDIDRAFERKTSWIAYIFVLYFET